MAVASMMTRKFDMKTFYGNLRCLWQTNPEAQNSSSKRDWKKKNPYNHHTLFQGDVYHHPTHKI